MQEEPFGEDDIPEETKEVIDDVVAALETISCREYGLKSGGLQVIQTEESEQGEACEISIPGGYSVHIKKLLAKHWDLIDG